MTSRSGTRRVGGWAVGAWRKGVGGVAALAALIGDRLGDGEPAGVVVGIETDRGIWVRALIAAGYRVDALNPMSVAGDRERRVVSGASSGAGDAQVLADLVRTGRRRHRPVAGGSELAGAVKVLAGTDQNLVWSRRSQANALRAALREFSPTARAGSDELAGGDALAVLDLARPQPGPGRCRRRRSPRRCAGLDGNATVRPGRSRSRPRCAPGSSRGCRPSKPRSGTP